jgi:hypothetical protein
MPSKPNRAAPISKDEFTNLLMSGHPAGSQNAEYETSPRDMDGLPTPPAQDPNKEADPLRDYWSAKGADDIRPDKDYAGRFRLPRNPHQRPRAKGPTNPAVQQLAQQAAHWFENTAEGKWIRKMMSQDANWSGSGQGEMPDLDHLEPDGEAMVSEDWNTRMGDILSREEPVRTGTTGRRM